LEDAVMEVGIRGDFQDRGYFKVLAHDPVSQPLSLSDGRQSILIVASLAEGPQFRLGTLTLPLATRRQFQRQPFETSFTFGTEICSMSAKSGLD
jgi:hypothetical protein